MNLTVSELSELVTNAGLHIETFDAVQNMPLLYKFALFRARTHKKFDENRARAEGYRLTWLGRRLQEVLMRFPHAFCNLYVVVARKP
ncbi:MAG: SAM-dependent methyltransferase, partial [Gammaproteobacteria bacterium SHHR-1]